MEPKFKDVRALTGVRGLAALHVALYHSIETKKVGSYFESGVFISPNFETFISHGYLAVDLFFMLSGYVMAMSSKKYFEGTFDLKIYADFMRRRFARLYPMYFVVLVVGFVFVNEFSGKLNFFVGLTLLSILFAPGYVLLHMWSLSAEWLAYLVFPILLKFALRFKSPLEKGISVFLAITLIFIALTLRDSDFARIPSIMKCFGEYILGIVAFELVRTWKDLFSYQHIISAGSLFLIIILLSINVPEIAIIALFFFLLIGLSNDKSWSGVIFSSRPVYFLGLISYSLYLVHPLFLYFFKDAFYAEYRGVAHASIMFNILFISATVATSYLTYRLIELPMQKLINDRVSFFPSSMLPILQLKAGPKK